MQPINHGSSASGLSPRQGATHQRRSNQQQIAKHRKSPKISKPQRVPQHCARGNGALMGRHAPSWGFLYNYTLPPGITRTSLTLSLWFPETFLLHGAQARRANDSRLLVDPTGDAGLAGYRLPANKATTLLSTCAGARCSGRGRFSAPPNEPSAPLRLRRRFSHRRDVPYALSLGANTSYFPDKGASLGQ